MISALPAEGILLVPIPLRCPEGAGGVVVLYAEFLRGIIRGTPG